LERGQVIQALQDNDVDDNTLVLFTSDNGPWFQGSPGRLRGRKGDTFEGGMREPFIARFPGRIPAAIRRARGLTRTTLDRKVDRDGVNARYSAYYRRIRTGTLPRNPLDGVDIGPVLTGQRST